jgi:Type IV pilin-like G and H, putative
MLRLSKFVLGLSLLSLITACQAQQKPNPAANQPPTGNPVAQNLIGTWTFPGVGGVDPVVLAFTPEGKLLVLQSLDNQTLATQFNYAIDPQSQPMYLDLKPQKPTVTDAEIAKTVFAINSSGDLVLPPLADMKPAQPRPPKIMAGVTYQKVAATTALQPQPQAFADLLKGAPKSDSTPTAQQGSSAGLMYLRLLAIAQQAYYLENGTLANALQQIGNPPMETPDYSYQMNFQGTELVVLTAQAKRPNLPSFVNVVFKLKPATVGYDVIYATGCKTVKPAPVPPAMPLIDFETGKVKCPGGAQEY